MSKPIISRSSLAILRRSYISSIYKSGVRFTSSHSTPAIQEGLRDFALTDRVAIVTGGNRGLGLEAALALSTAGSRTVYCLDLPEKPGEDWNAARQSVAKLEGAGRLEYVTADVRNQKRLFKMVEEIATKEGRMDICVAAAGISGAARSCLEYTEEELEEVRRRSYVIARTKSNSLRGSCCKPQRGVLQCSSCCKANGSVPATGKHHPPGLHRWQCCSEGSYSSALLTYMPLTARSTRQYFHTILARPQ
jgi:hypothetical protein